LQVVVLAAVAAAFGLAQTTPVRAASAFVVNPSGDFSHLHYVAAPGETNDASIRFAPNFSGVDITDSGATITPGAGCATLTPNKVRCTGLSADPVINASLGDGNDILSISRNFESSGGVLKGGDGDDRIRGGNTPRTHERLLGGPGDDTLFGRGGSDFLDGGFGADDLSGGTSCGLQTGGFCANRDIDTVSYASRAQNVHADADGDAADDGQRREGDTIMFDVERIVGGTGNDRLGGATSLGMQLAGRAGDDVLLGGRASDLLEGGQGSDVLRGARGSDLLRGNRGHDRLLANDGRLDHVNGGRGFDKAAVDGALDRWHNIEKLL
jgi:Ca2+-binding RTX toxin-like protein